MRNLKFFDDMINKKLLDLHTAFLAKILSVSGNQAKIQPLGLTKEIGGTARPYAPVSSVPFTRNSRYKLSADGGVLTASAVTNGDIVICVCCDRDITEAKCGKNVLPPVGHHNMSDCIIIGVL